MIEKFKIESWAEDLIYFKLNLSIIKSFNF